MDIPSHRPDGLELLIAPGTLPFFATVLQAGIVLQARAGDTLGVFLDKLPGFTREYIINEIQTIFLNGTAIDDLETPLAGDNPVLALSAAMPGLAGAIFRKNSFHAALRTTHEEKDNFCRDHRLINVRLKLFNSIARDRGADLLGTGVCIKASNLLNFISTSPALLDHLRIFSLDGQKRPGRELSECLDPGTYYHLTVREIA